MANHIDFITIDDLKLVWKTYPPFHVWVKVDTKVRMELLKMMAWSLEKPNDLVSHTIFFPELKSGSISYMDSPSVSVEGKGDKFVCEYNDKTKWVTLDDSK